MLKIIFQEQKFWKLKKKKRMLKMMKVYFYFIIIKDKTTPIFLLTLKSVCCLNIQSADIY